MMQESVIDDLNDTARAFNNLNNTVVSVVPIDTGGNNLVVIALFLDSLVLVCGDSSSPLLVRWSQRCASLIFLSDWRGSAGFNACQVYKFGSYINLHVYP